MSSSHLACVSLSLLMASSQRTVAVSWCTIVATDSLVSALSAARAKVIAGAQVGVAGAWR